MLNFLCSGMRCFGIQENVVLVSFGFISMKKIECIPMRATQHSQNSNNYLFLSTLSFIVNFFWKVLLLCNTREIVYLFTKGLDLLDCAPHRTKRFIELLTYSSILGYLCEQWDWDCQFLERFRESNDDWSQIRARIRKLVEQNLRHLKHFLINQGFLVKLSLKRKSTLMQFFLLKIYVYFPAAVVSVK